MCLTIRLAGANASNCERKHYYQNLTNVQTGLMSLLVEVIKTSNDTTLRRIFKGSSCVIEVKQMYTNTRKHFGKRYINTRRYRCRRSKLNLFTGGADSSFDEL